MTQKGKANINRKRGSVDGTKGRGPKRNKERVFDWSLEADAELKWLRADSKSGLCSTFSAFFIYGWRNLRHGHSIS